MENKQKGWGDGLVYLRGTDYWVQYSVDGHRRRESAGTADERKAHRFLRERIDAAQKAAEPKSKQDWGNGFIYLRGDNYWVQYSVNGHRRRESAQTTDERKANKFLRDRLNAAEGGTLPPTKTLIGQLLDNLKRNYREKNPKSADWCELVVEVHLRKPFEYLRASDLGTAHLNRYIDARRAREIGNATINRELALLRRSYYLGLNEHEPPLVNKVPHIPRLEEAPPRSGFFEWEDFQRLRIELPEDIGDLALFAYWVGVRKGEILKLRWPQVDLRERIVRLEKTKNGEDRDVPMSADLYEMFARRAKNRSARCPWVFSRDGERIKSFKGAWAAACKRCGFEEKKLLHDMRRTAVRNLINAGVSRKVAMRITGHRTEAVFERYHIVETDDIRDAMQKVERRHHEKARQ